MGGQSGNFKRLIGGTSDIGSPHYLAHVFLNQAIGKDGRKFFVTFHPAATIYNQKLVEELKEDFRKLAKRKNSVT